MKENFYRYTVYILIVILGVLGLFYTKKAYGSEHFAYDNYGNVYVFQHPLAKKHMDMILENNLNLHICRALDLDNCKTNAQKVQFHKENGERCLADARERCWWLPYIPARDKARYCFTNIGILSCPGDPRSKIIAAIVNTLIQYGIDCQDEWHYINNKLYWSQYHFEMMEFHQQLIAHGYP